MAPTSRVDALAVVVRQTLESLAPSNVCVAWSGGSDSTALLLASSACGPVRAVHVHHGQPHSDAAEDHVRSVASEIGVSLDVLRIDIEEGAGFEERARDRRFAVLGDYASEDTLVLLGHHADDLVETVLHNLFRGTGPRGLSGPRRVHLPFARPLLGESRAVLAAVVREAGLPIFEDPTNSDTSATRNWIRHDVLPVIARRFPSSAVAIERASGLIAADDRLLRSLVPDVIRPDGGATAVPWGVVATLDAPVATRLIRRMLVQARPPLTASHRDIDQVLSVVHGHRRAQLDGGFLVEREGPLVVVYHPDDVVIPTPVTFSPPGSVVFGFQRIAARPWDADRPIIGRGRAAVVIDPHESMTVRACKHGDRIEIGEGTKLVHDALSEAGVPPRRRSGWPVVWIGGKIAWIAGVRAAAWVRPDGVGRGTIELSVERDDQ